MIGIINNNLESYIIIEEIRKKYALADIYISNDNDIKKAITKLKNKGCKIIIISGNNILALKKEYMDIVILSIPVISDQKLFLLDSSELIKAVTEGNTENIERLLGNINIPSNKKILINNPKLLLIKDIISEKLPNPIVTSIDYLLIELEKVVTTEKINCGKQKITNTIY